MRARFLAVAAVPLLLAACGGDGNGDDDATPAPGGAFMDESAPQLSDVEYVAALCDGVEEWNDALNSKGTVEELQDARAKLEADTRALHPPEGAADFQRDYVEYLANAESDPTLLATQPPPLPEGELRARLAEAEAEAGCEFALFTRGETSPTPGG